MPIEQLNRDQLSDADAEEALTNLPPTDDAALVMLRNLQAQINALSARITALGG